MDAHNSDALVGEARAGISPAMRQFAAYIADASRMPLPDAVTEATKHHLIDTLAAMISGSRLLPGEKASEMPDSCQRLRILDWPIDV